MPRYFYGTVPALAWIINHYFYGGVHYTWLAEEFHPLETNPKSSNPYLIYGDLYWAWSRGDPYDKFVSDTRRRLVFGIDEQEKGGVVDNITAARLRRVCRDVAVELFYPVVYRVDVSMIPAVRWTLENSARTGSREVLVRDLVETEFDLLFADNARDPEFGILLADEIAGVTATAPANALARLEGRLAQ